MRYPMWERRDAMPDRQWPCGNGYRLAGANYLHRKMNMACTTLSTFFLYGTYLTRKGDQPLSSSSIFSNYEIDGTKVYDSNRRKRMNGSRCHKKLLIVNYRTTFHFVITTITIIRQSRVPRPLVLIIGIILQLTIDKFTYVSLLQICNNKSIFW